MPSPKVPDWWTPDDPWLTTRMRHMAEIEAGEREAGLAVEKAMAVFLDAARESMLNQDIPFTPAGSTAGTVTADAQMPPDANGWPDTSIWRDALEAFLFPILGGLFGERFKAEIRRASISDEPWRLEYIQTVWDRLVLWPKTAWEEQIQPELAEGIAEGEDHRQLRERVGEALNINARSRRIQAEIGQLTKTIENPDTPTPIRREARSRRSALYRTKEREDRRWWFYAARIARTETLGALNAGSWHGANAYAQQTGEERWKQWWSTSDTRVRPSHWAAHMQVQPLGEKFRVGGHGLDHPGDPNGPADEVINCRCSLLTMGRAEAEREQDRYEKFLPGRTDIHGRPLDEDGEPIVAAATGGTMTAPATIPADAEQAPRLPWRGILAPLGVRSGDYRRIDAPPNGVLRTRDFPLPLLFQEKLAPGHADAEQGLINITSAAIVNGREASALGLDSGGRELAPDAQFLIGEGAFDDGDPEAVELARKVDGGFARWVSVDLDDVGETTWHRYRGDEDLGPIDWEDDDILLLLGFQFADQTERVQHVRQLAVEKYGLADEDGEDVVEVISQWRLMGATLVSHPAFHEAFIQLTHDDAPAEDEEAAAQDTGKDQALVAAVVGDTGLPVAADRDHAWDAGAAKKRIKDWASGEDGEIVPSKYSKAFLWRDPDGKDTAVGSYKFPFADVVDGTLTIIAHGVFAAAQRLDSGDIPAADKDTMRGKLTTLYGRLREKYKDDTIQPPWKASIDSSRVATPSRQLHAALTASGQDTEQRRSWAHRVAQVAAELYEPSPEMFAPPNLTGPTALTIEPNGHVYGHVHDWTTAHISYGKRRPVRAPRSASNYAHFNLKGVRCSDGSKIKCGALVLGTGHASTDRGVTPHQAGAHYDHTGHRVARIRVGADQFGTWFSGALVPNVTPDQILEMSELSVSGDWREGELVAALVVNVPGLPIIEGEDAEEPEAMVAAGMIIRSQPMPMGSFEITPAALQAALERNPMDIAREVVALLRGDRERERQVDAMAASVYSGGLSVLENQVYGRS